MGQWSKHGSLGVLAHVWPTSLPHWNGLLAVHSPLLALGPSLASFPVPVHPLQPPSTPGWGWLISLFSGNWKPVYFKHVQESTGSDMNPMVSLGKTCISPSCPWLPVPGCILCASLEPFPPDLGAELILVHRLQFLGGF